MIQQILVTVDFTIIIVYGYNFLDRPMLGFLIIFLTPIIYSEYFMQLIALNITGVIIEVLINVKIPKSKKSIEGIKPLKILTI